MSLRERLVDAIIKYANAELSLCTACTGFTPRITAAENAWTAIEELLDEAGILPITEDPSAVVVADVI